MFSCLIFCLRYYQVIVRELPTDNRDNPVPETQEPDHYKPDKLRTYEEARAAKPKLEPYVAAQFPASKFHKYSAFIVGNGGTTRASAKRQRRDVGNETLYYNGPLEPSTYYTVFQRAYVTKVREKEMRGDERRRGERAVKKLKCRTPF